MKKLIIPLFGTLLLAGCGGSGSGSSFTSNNPVSTDCNFNKQTVINLINQERAKAKNCGSTAYPAVGNVTWNDTLQKASQKHSYDMASKNFFEHTGSDGSSVSNRVDTAGYDWQTVAENLAAGDKSAQSAINRWFHQSETHCKNMMNSTYTEVGLACSYDAKSTYKTYWALTLASPQ